MNIIMQEDVLHIQKDPVVLVVDDTEYNLDLLEFALKRKPVKMLRASSGAECLSIAQETPPDIILLDIQMPVMDGFETLRRLRENPLTQQIPVIILTAQRKDPDSIEKGLQLGADAYLTKPIEIDELLVRIRMLLKVQQMEQELDQTKADFMAMLVHDLRSPLIGIRSVVDLLRELPAGTPITNDHRAMLETSEFSLGQILLLINNLLDLSKYTSKTISLSCEPVPFPMLIDHVFTKISYQFNKKQIQFVKQWDKELPEIYVDAEKTQQIFLNLLDNALKFTKPGGTVTISAEKYAGRMNGNDESKNFLRISVRDTGIGINRDELQELFKPYQQTSSGKHAGNKGTGLGLAICKLIVEAHGGSIEAESEPGKYTEFHLTLPVSEQN
jgi:two-component system, sensor histidine kinase and response regulator